MKYEATQEFALSQDNSDSLKSFRERFHIPIRNEKPSIYFCGNSLGLQPRQTRQYLEEELVNWQENGVEGHFLGANPWISYGALTKPSLNRLVGGLTSEVVSMNNLTTNLHLMLASFYHPMGRRTKIMIESGAFPSDHYAVQSHIQRIGLDPQEHLIILKPRTGHLFSTEEIIEAVEEAGGELALILFPGIQYYTGQFFDLKAIAHAAHSVGAFAGFDLAHAMGNLPMDLHEDQVDFATWCSYKYLNSGPGGTSGIFVHEKHSNNPNFPKLTGWWGHEEKTRFKMDNRFKPSPGVDAWMLSNINILSTSAHRASLAIFDEAGIEHLRAKSIRLTGFLEFLLETNPILKEKVSILSPRDPKWRGCQLSVSVDGGKAVFEELIKAGVILDWREPGVIRLAPVPLYNSFTDVWNFHKILIGVYER